MGSLINIKPIISMENGEIISVGQERSRKKAYMQMVKLIKKTIGDNRKIKIAYMHAAAFEEINQLKLLIEENFTVVESIISELPPALGVQTGPGTTGLCYFPVNH